MCQFLYIVMLCIPTNEHTLHMSWGLLYSDNWIQISYFFLIPCFAGNVHSVCAFTFNDIIFIHGLLLWCVSLCSLCGDKAFCISMICVFFHVFFSAPINITVNNPFDQSSKTHFSVSFLFDTTLSDLYYFFLYWIYNSTSIFTIFF